MKSLKWLHKAVRTFARVGHMHNDTLNQIAVDAFLKYNNSTTENTFLKTKGSFRGNGISTHSEIIKIQDLENSNSKEAVKVVIFLNTFLESYFFEFSAITLGQQYSENHIGKLDLASKIVLISKLVTGRGIDTSLHFWGENKN